MTSKIITIMSALLLGTHSIVAQVVVKALEGGSPLYTATKTYTANNSFVNPTCPPSSKLMAQPIRYNGTTTATKTSTISQADADQKAMQAAIDQYNELGEQNATNGTCYRHGYPTATSYPPPRVKHTTGCSPGGNAIVIVTVKLEGTVYTYSQDENMQIIDAAEEVGIYLPYSSRVGADNMSAGEIIQGEVDPHDQSYLDDEQMNEGLFLYDVATPCSNIIFEAGTEVQIKAST